MQIVDNSVGQYKYFFLQGYRAESTGAGADGMSTEKVGALVLKQAVDSSGNILNDPEVLLTDESFTSLPDDPLMQFESDLAVFKPQLDIVVSRLVTDILEHDPAPAKPFFGNVTITRNGVDDPVVSLLNYGWRLRTETSPGRGDEAGDAASFTADVELPEKLPANFNNTFFNGGRDTTHQKLVANDEVEFEEVLADTVTPSGYVFTVLVPDQPQLIFKKDDQAIEPQPTTDYFVDTVVLDQSANQVLLTWRAVFDWDDQYELSILEIN